TTPNVHPLMITCTRRIGFDAAHRVMGHEGICKNLHGHHYVIEATFSAAQIDALGRVIDFGVIKQKLGAWINEHWDHNTILWEQDRTLGRGICDVTQQQIFYLPYNPTAENMALFLLQDICPRIFDQTGIRCISVRLYETPNCYAEAN